MSAFQIQGPGGGGGLYDAYAYVRDEKTAGTVGGLATTGSFQTRTLNTEVDDADGIVSLSSNEFTLQAGTYYLRATAPFYQVNRCKLKIRNITDSTDAILGEQVFAGTGVIQMAHGHVSGTVTIASAKAFALQYRCDAGGSVSFELGVESNFGLVEVYAEVEIWRYA